MEWNQKKGEVLGGVEAYFGYGISTELGDFVEAVLGCVWVRVAFLDYQANVDQFV